MGDCIESVHLAVPVPGVVAGASLTCLWQATVEAYKRRVSGRERLWTWLWVRRLLDQRLHLARTELPVLWVVQVSVAADDQRGHPSHVR